MLACVSVYFASLVSDRARWQCAAPPEHFSRDALIPISLPGPGELRFGVDPQTLSVGPDEVVHYVLVASTSLAMNVSYEGVDCKNARTRVDARWNEHTGWKLLPDSPWRNLGEDRATRHATALAKGGMCDGRTPNAPVARIAHELRLGRSDINSH
jgi:hypothetical protein